VKKLLAVLISVLALSLASCSSDSDDTTSTQPGSDPTTSLGAAREGTLHEIDADTTIEAAEGSTFTLSLEANATTGYNWAESVDGTAVRSEGGEYEAPGDAVPGRGGRQLYTYEAVEAGAATIELTYTQVGSGDIGQAYTVTVDVS
jgi:predicted secreted protein